MKSQRMDHNDPARFGTSRPYFLRARGVTFTRDYYRAESVAPGAAGAAGASMQRVRSGARPLMRT